MSLAPDSASARSGRELASVRRWRSLGRDQRACWGECQGSRAIPYQTQIDLTELAYRCSCPSRRVPCKHVLGLFLLFAEVPGAFPESSAPDWVREWLEARAARAEAKKEPGQPDAEPESRPDPDLARAKRAAGREARVAAGLEELRRWLLDLLRQGLATTQGRPYHFWETTAARMVDAQAPGVARLVRGLAAIPSSGEGWHERLLEELGRLFLLIEGYSRLSSLPEPVQADIRALIGWTIDQKALLATQGIVDHWLVLGQRGEIEDRLKVQRTWLRGRRSKQDALVLHFAPIAQPLVSSLVPGTAFDGSLVFFPGSVRRRAILQQQASEAGPIEDVPAACSLDQALAAHAAGLAANPWTERTPIALEGVTPVHRRGAWRLRDRTGRVVVLCPRGADGWRLLACSGGHPIGIFGEFDGDALLPLGFWNHDGYSALVVRDDSPP